MQRHSLGSDGAERLGALELFADTTVAERRMLARIVDEIVCEQGETIMHEGSSEYEFMVIEQGTAEVTRRAARSTGCRPGGFFGELAVLGDGTPRTATVTATSPLRGLVFTAHFMREARQRLPVVGERIDAAAEEHLQADAGRPRARISHRVHGREPARGQLVGALRRRLRLCAWTVAVLLGWDRDGRLRPGAIQGADGRGLLADLEQQERLSAWHLVGPAGARSSGGAAIAPLLRLLPGGTPLAGAASLGAGSQRTRLPLGGRAPRGALEAAAGAGQAAGQAGGGTCRNRAPAGAAPVTSAAMRFAVKFLGCKVSQADAMLARRQLLQAGHEEVRREGGRAARDQHLLHHPRGGGEVAPVGAPLAAERARGVRGRLRGEPATRPSSRRSTLA